MARGRWILAALLFVFPVVSFADPIQIGVGVISFDTLSVGPDGSTVNAFFVLNQTGDPLLPFFPVLVPLTFNNSKLKLVFDDDSTLDYDFGAIGPGSVEPPFELQFSGSVLFKSAIFTATLSQLSFLIDGGDLFIADASDFSVELLPPGATTLTPGDQAVFTVSGRSVPPVSTVPEPRSMPFLVTGLVALVALTMKWRINPRPQCAKDYYFRP